MWIEVDTHAFKQGRNECLASLGIIVHWRIKSSLQVELYMQVELGVSHCLLHDEQQPLYIHINGRIKIIVHHGICFDLKMVQ